MSFSGISIGPWAKHSSKMLLVVGHQVCWCTGKYYEQWVNTIRWHPLLQLESHRGRQVCLILLLTESLCSVFAFACLLAINPPKVRRQSDHHNHQSLKTVWLCLCYSYPLYSACLGVRYKITADRCWVGKRRPLWMLGYTVARQIKGL